MQPVKDMNGCIFCKPIPLFRNRRKRMHVHAFRQPHGALPQPFSTMQYLSEGKKHLLQQVHHQLL